MVGVVGLPMAVGLGLVYGLGPCLVSCLPYLGPVFLNSDGGVRASWRVLLPLSLGRLTVYGGFGAISGWWAQRYVAGVDVWVINLVTGMAALLVGLSLLLRRLRGRSCALRSCVGQVGKPSQHRVMVQYPSLPRPPISEPAMPAGLFLMGMGMALTPCAPMSVVFVSAAAAGSPLWGLTLGLGFGIGAIVAPSLVYGLAVAYFGKRLREELGTWLPRFECLSSALFLVIAIRQIRLGFMLAT
jgi:thiol:disulfide interchange protein DsbD